MKYSFDGLTALLAKEEELVLAVSEGKLILNGVLAGGPAAVQQMLIQFYEKNRIYSLTFRRGLGPDEMTAFYNLFTGKKDNLNSPEDFSKYLADEKVVHIAVNTAFFAKVSEKDAVDAGAAGSGAGSGVSGEAAGSGGPGAGIGEGKGKVAALVKKMESMSLDNMLLEVVRQAVQKRK